MTPLPFLCLMHYHFSIFILLFECFRMSLPAPTCFGACCLVVSNALLSSRACSRCKEKAF